MGKVERYEDLRCWQQARVLVNQVYELISSSPLMKDYALTDQLKRASISVMTNIAEGFSRYHKKDFIRFLDYSQSSAQEVKSLLYIVADQELIEQAQIKDIQNNCDQCRAMTLALLKYVNESLKNTNQTTEPQILYLADNHINT